MAMKPKDSKRSSPRVRDAVAVTNDESNVGLRERKKAATRAALAEAALRLATKRGLADVRVEDIAAEAGVSPRTFNNYFPSKEAAIVAVGTERGEVVRGALLARPASEDVWTALRHAAEALFPEEPDRAFMARAKLMKDEPSLATEQLRSDALIERELSMAIAERTRTSATSDLYPRLVAATFIAAVHVALDSWLAAPKGTTLRATIADALERVAEGLPAPRSAAVRRTRAR